MAFGFPASFSERVQLNIPRAAAREAVSYALDTLGWHFETSDHDTFCAKVGLSDASWGERVTISLAEAGVLEIRSVCSYPLQMIDWNKNKQNVTRFLTLFEIKSARESKLPHEEPEYFDADGRTPLERAINGNDSRIDRAS
jgi:hypothetical protein